MSGTPTNFPPAGPPVTQIIPCYPYVEYQDDDNVSSFFAAYNQLAQNDLDALNSLNLPIYTNGVIQGSLLDWVGQGIYGMSRPVIPTGQLTLEGPFNTYQFNSLVFNGRKVINSGTFFTATDDVYKRCLTWAFYKGDGVVTSIPWIKRRIARWFWGVNGTDVGAVDQKQISVVPSNGNTLIVTIHTTGGMPTLHASVFVAAVDARILELPFKFTTLTVNVEA